MEAKSSNTQPKAHPKAQSKAQSKAQPKAQPKAPHLTVRSPGRVAPQGELPGITRGTPGSADAPLPPSLTWPMSVCRSVTWSLGLLLDRSFCCSVARSAVLLGHAPGCCLCRSVSLLLGRSVCCSVARSLGLQSYWGTPPAVVSGTHGVRAAAGELRTPWARPR